MAQVFALMHLLGYRFAPRIRDLADRRLLRDANGNPIEIDNVWALQFGQDGGPNGAH
jgi:TnpA family transposase